MSQPPSSSSSLFGKLQSGLSYLDGAFKDTLEGQQEQGQEEGELLEEVAAQRLQVNTCIIKVGTGALLSWVVLVRWLVGGLRC